MAGYLSKKQSGMGKTGAVVHGSVAFIGFLTQVTRHSENLRSIKGENCEFLGLQVGLCYPNYR